jgi:hypothetical protein
MAELILLHHRKFLRRFLLCSLLLPALLTGTAHGQSAEETAGQRIRIKAFGMFSYVHPDHLAPSKNKGVTVGLDIDGFHLLPHTELGADLRYAATTGPVENHYYYAGGPRLSLNVGRFKPYADFLFGHGEAVFRNPSDPNYRSDVSPALTYGGGLDYQLTRSWAIRADVQQERWRFSIRQPIFYPLSASVGVSYQFHFHSRTGPNL